MEPELEERRRALERSFDVEPEAQPPASPAEATDGEDSPPPAP
jgi:hypothetical protein